VPCWTRSQFARLQHTMVAVEVCVRTRPTRTPSNVNRVLDGTLIDVAPTQTGPLHSHTDVYLYEEHSLRKQHAVMVIWTPPACATNARVWLHMHTDTQGLPAKVQTRSGDHDCNA